VLYGVASQRKVERNAGKRGVAGFVVGGCHQLSDMRELVMFVQVTLAALSKVKWTDVATRFLFGGAVTAITGLLAKHFGPTFGGLFLAFPAIFPASVTLLAKKQEEAKAKHGTKGAHRGREAAALEARGAIFGCVGLACFGLIVWKMLQDWNGAGVLALATAAWVAISIALWALTRRARHAWRRGRTAS